MRFTTLDTIVKGALIKKQYPIHFYIQFLYFATRALEELHFDSLQNVKTVKLTADDNFSITVPCDCMDIVKFGVPNGQFVRQLYQREGINILPNYDENDNVTKYPEGGFDLHVLDNMLFRNYLVYPFDTRGLRFYGISSNDDTQSFKFIPEQGRIQLNQQLGTKEGILQYITDGSDADNATMVDPRAKAVIESYVLWQMKESSRAYGEGERERAKQLFQADHARFRARKNKLGKEEIIAIVRGAAKGSPKI
jgi:hypothetical protein